jgi:hypothetical protein
MKAGLRFGLAYLAAALALAPTAALAQQAPATTTEARPSDIPATDAVGPRDLQNFNLSGRVTRQADRPVAVEPVARQDRTGTASPTATPSAAASSTTPAPTRATTNERPRPAEVASTDNPAPERSPEPTGRSEPGLSVTAPLPQLGGPPASATDTIAPSPRFATAAAAPTNLAPEHSFGMLPWLLAAIALGGGAIFLFWRSRSREAFAGGPRADAFEAPEPAPRAQPRPAPAPRAPAPAPTPTPSIPGTVSTRLRPWIEIGFQPLRCIVDDSQVVIEFEAELLNSGSAAARAVLAEASLFNAGPTQDQDLGAFFANPVGAGELQIDFGRQAPNALDPGEKRDSHLVKI